MENSFSKEDYDLIFGLVSLTKSILEDYEILHKLELSNKKDTYEFNCALESLKFDINLENSIYKLIDKDTDFVYKLINYVYPNNKPCFDDELEQIKKENIDELVKIRIVSRLYELLDKFIYENNKTVKFTNEEDEELIDNAFFDEMINNEEYFNEESDLEMAKIEQNLEVSIENDIINSILVILNQYINNEKYKEYKEKLLKLKYYFSFVYHLTEDYLVENNMLINNSLYIGSTLTADIEKIDYNNLLRVINNYKEELIEHEIDSLFITMLDNLKEDEIKFQTIVAEIYLRSFFIFGSKTDFMRFKDVVFMECEMIEIDKTLINELLNNIGKSLNNDQTLPIIVNLSPYLKRFG